MYVLQFLFECLRWGPTSLQTVKQHVSGVLQFVRSWGPKIKILKHTLLLLLII